MQRIWSADELGEYWSLLPEDLALLAGKLGFAVQLAFWRQHGRFPDDEADGAPAVIAHLAAQIGVSVEALDGYAWAGRSGRRHRVAIIDHLAVAAFDEAAEGRFRRWLADKGHDLRLIQDYLGHRDPRHTVHYTRTAGRRFEGLWSR
jgi:Domain of unknown function (DUF4158)